MACQMGIKLARKFRNGLVIEATLLGTFLMIREWDLHLMLV